MQKIDYLLNYLLDEKHAKLEKELSIIEKKALFRGLMNVREPKDISPKFLEVQNEYLKSEISKKGITDVNSLTPIEDNIYLWQGDITTINSDVIVNAGNEYGLGCFVPNHHCIDNAIHSFSGVQLRKECNNILKGRLIPVGDMIVCHAYNLPSKLIITTVGPQISTSVSKTDGKKLSECYKKPLEYAIKHKLTSIAFPSISTGLYRYPIGQAKYIAYNTIKKISKNKNIKVIINVFNNEDYNEYKQLFN